MQVYSYQPMYAYLHVYYMHTSYVWDIVVSWQSYIKYNPFPIYKTSYEVIFLDSEENLRAALGKMGVSSRALEDVIDKARNKHYQVRKWLASFVLETFLYSFLKSKMFYK